MGDKRPKQRADWKTNREECDRNTKTFLHPVPNVKDEPHAQPARLVRQHEA